MENCVEGRIALEECLTYLSTLSLSVVIRKTIVMTLGGVGRRDCGTLGPLFTRYQCCDLLPFLGVGFVDIESCRSRRRIPTRQDRGYFGWLSHVA